MSQVYESRENFMAKYEEVSRIFVGHPRKWLLNSEEATREKFEVFKLVKDNIHHITHKEICMFLRLFDTWNYNYKDFQKINLELTEEIFSILKPYFYRAVIQKECIDKGIMYYHIENDSDAEIIYHIYAGDIGFKPTLEEPYSAIVCLYIGLYLLRFTKITKEQLPSNYFKKGSLLESDPDHVYCLLKYAHLQDDSLEKKNLYKLCVKKNCSLALRYLLDEPKYCKMALQLEEERSAGLPIWGLGKDHPNYYIHRQFLLTTTMKIRDQHEVLRTKTSDIEIYAEYLDLYQKYHELLNKFEEDTIIYDKYYFSFPERKDIRRDDIKTISHMFDNPYNYYLILYYIKKLKKYILSLEEEVKYIPGTGEKYLELEREFQAEIQSMQI